MDNLQVLIFLPILVGIVLFIIPESLKVLKGIVALLISVYASFTAVIFFGNKAGISLFECTTFPALTKYTAVNTDSLSKLITLFVSLLGFLYLLYSLGYIKKDNKLPGYYSYFLITLGSAIGAVLTDNFVIFIFFWGVLGLTLYKLIRSDNEKGSSAAKKSLIIIGASDSFMIFGIAILYKLSGTFTISQISVSTSGSLPIIAFICLLAGSFAKAGAFPLHSWVPDYVEKAPASSSAFLPASLDKLLGIYFLARICMNIFSLTSWATLLLLIIGGITIIAAVMMALVQHNCKRLLGFHAVSQVGYMITGFALGTPLGIAAGLFHMVNHALYKSGLFLTAGNVESRTNKEDLSELGGLSKAMPITFISALIFAFSISGIPPFNGFASKWMIYQGIVDFGKGSGIANNLWFVWLGLAILGSALTLASFIKFITGVYLGRKREEYKSVKEVNPLMWIPPLFIALVCVFFGIFASKLIVPSLITTVSGDFDYIGLWSSGFVSILILVSVVIGYLIYLAGNIKNLRTKDSFLCGEKNHDEVNFGTGEFYKTISDFKILKWVYLKAEKKWFDVYDISKRLILFLNKTLSNAHTGFLPAYVLWYIAGLLIILIILIF